MRLSRASDCSTEVQHRNMKQLNIDGLVKFGRRLPRYGEGLLYKHSFDADNV